MPAAQTEADENPRTLYKSPSSHTVRHQMRLLRMSILYRGGSRNSLKGGGGSGPEFFEWGGGGLGSRSVGIFIY